MTDDEFLDRLIAASAAAIRGEKTGILYDRSRLRSIQIDLSVMNNGGIVEGEVYLQRRADLRKLLQPGPAVPAEGVSA
jgi:hypothetical protein